MNGYYRNGFYRNLFFGLLIMILISCFFLRFQEVDMTELPTRILFGWPFPWLMIHIDSVSSYGIMTPEFTFDILLFVVDLVMFYFVVTGVSGLVGTIKNKIGAKTK